jgi:putative ABC transport system ATP-binding protein
MLFQKDMKQHSENLIELVNVSKTYPLAVGSCKALDNVSLSLPGGKLIAITGKSGSGKSTLLNIIAGIDRPSDGQIFVNQIGVNKLNEDELATWRGKNIGVVFQFFQLLPTLTVLENVLLPMDFGNTYPKHERKTRALSLLEGVGIREQADKLPSALSGGQQQRAAIARALANDPAVIIADEPTGNLDSQTAKSILTLFSSLVNNGKTVIVVTHEKEFSSHFQLSIKLEDGKIHK